MLFSGATLGSFQAGFGGEGGDVWMEVETLPIRLKRGIANPEIIFTCFGRKEQLRARLRKGGPMTHHKSQPFVAKHAKAGVSPDPVPCLLPMKGLVIGSRF